MRTGAASTAKDSAGIRRFHVFRGHQLHGDFGERLGKTRKYFNREWKRMVEDQNLGLESKEVSWCLREACPPHMMLPEDWDVLGQVPNNEKTPEENKKSVENPEFNEKTKRKARKSTLEFDEKTKKRARKQCSAAHPRTHFASPAFRILF